MINYTYTLEKVENGRKIIGGMLCCEHKNYPELALLSVVEDIVTKAAMHDFPEGEITEIKATKCKNGSVVVNITGPKDRISANVWRQK